MPDIRFDAKTHTYTVDGAVFPSVTQICRFLQYDKASGGNQWIRDAAGARGTAIHAYTQMLDNGLRFDYPGDISGYLQAYQAFCRDYTPQWLAIEQRIANNRLKVAGTLDRFGLMDGAYTIVDLKSTSNLDKDYVSAQLHGYKAILTVEGALNPLIADRAKPVKLYALQLKKDGNYRLYRANDKGEELFSYCLKIHNLREEVNHAK